MIITLTYICVYYLHNCTIHNYSTFRSAIEHQCVVVLIITGTLEIPVVRPLELFFRLKDVIHFFVPKLRIKQDLVPGMEMSIHFTAASFFLTTLGEFRSLPSSHRANDRWRTRWGSEDPTLRR